MLEQAPEFVGNFHVATELNGLSNVTVAGVPVLLTNLMQDNEVVILHKDAIAQVQFIDQVKFGEMWKTSLTELSGGQMSLLSLSLILAILLFKPAPLYILDEVDSALDVSHTQFIGVMLKKHFKQSQFIMISLKQGTCSID